MSRLAAPGDDNRAFLTRARLPGIDAMQGEPWIFTLRMSRARALCHIKARGWGSFSHSWNV
jgi:hypothetical protein